MKSQRYWVLVPAAGTGFRVGSDIPKQYLVVAGRTVLNWTLKALARHEIFEKIVLVLHPRDEHFVLDDSAIKDRLMTVSGGKERMDSVMRGLETLAPLADDNDWVLVHDAARPCVSYSDIENLINAVSSDCVGGILAAPVKDTLKKASSECTIAATLDRSQYFLAATPQMFRYGLLCKALRHAADSGLDVTDEASAIEKLKLPVKIVPGRSDNIKITHPEDLAVVEFLIKRSGNLR